MKANYCRLAVIAIVGSMGYHTVAAQDGLSLMKVEPAARPSGMAGAFVAIGGDPNSSAYNPAGAISPATPQPCATAFRP